MIKPIRTLLGTPLLLCACALFAPLLSGCVPVAAVGMGAGALMIADRRPAEIYVADEAIEARAASRIGEKFGDKVHVNVTCFNRVVLLTGEVPSEAAKAEIGRLVGSVPNVRGVTDELAVAGASSFGARSNDSLLTSKVKARFIDAGKFQVNHVKVVTEAGVVYLLGLVTQREADAAVDIARTTGGVQKVVRVFEVVSEQEAKELDRRADANKSTAAKEAKTP